MEKLIENLIDSISVPSVEMLIKIKDYITDCSYFIDPNTVSIKGISDNGKVFNPNIEILKNQIKNLIIEEVTLKIYFKSGERNLYINASSLIKNLYIESNIKSFGYLNINNPIFKFLYILCNKIKDLDLKLILESINNQSSVNFLLLNKIVFNALYSIDFYQGVYVGKDLSFTKDLNVIVYFKSDDDLAKILISLKDQNLSKEYKQNIKILLIRLQETSGTEDYFIYQVIDYLKINETFQVNYRKDSKEDLKNLSGLTLHINSSEPFFESYFISNLLLRHHVFSNISTFKFDNQNNSKFVLNTDSQINEFKKLKGIYLTIN